MISKRFSTLPSTRISWGPCSSQAFCSYEALPFSCSQNGYFHDILYIRLYCFAKQTLFQRSCFNVSYQSCTAVHLQVQISFYDDYLVCSYASILSSKQSTSSTLLATVEHSLLELGAAFLDETRGALWSLHKTRPKGTMGQYIFHYNCSSLRCRGLHRTGDIKIFSCSIRAIATILKRFELTSPPELLNRQGLPRFYINILSFHYAGFGEGVDYIQFW